LRNNNGQCIVRRIGL